MKKGKHGSMDTLVVSIAAQKGGVGKSTSARLLASVSPLWSGR